MEIIGRLHVTPELTWEELRNSSYIPFELAVAQGRNSQATMGMQAEMKERLTEDGSAFVKYADSLLFERVRRTEPARTLAWYIEQVIQRFPEHIFEGDFEIDMMDGGRDGYRIEVRNDCIKVLKPRQVWVDRELSREDLDRLTRDSHLLAEAQTLIQRMSVYGMHSGEHVDINGREGCLGCDVDRFQARNARPRG